MTPLRRIGSAFMKTADRNDDTAFVKNTSPAATGEVSMRRRSGSAEISTSESSMLSWFAIKTNGVCRGRFSRPITRNR